VVPLGRRNLYLPDRLLPFLLPASPSVHLAMDFPLARSATGYPEIWRQGAERRAIALTSPLPFLTCGVFAYVTARLGLHSVSGAVKLAVAVWLIGPLPLILTDAAFMKLHRVFVVSYALGWLK
jgi:hypothetical protein